MQPEESGVDRRGPARPGAPGGNRRKADLGALERLRLAGVRDLGSGTGFESLALAAMAKCPPFSALGPTAAKRLCGRMGVHEAQPGQCIAEENGPSDFVVLILSGAVEILRRNPNRYPVRLAVVEAGASVGEMSMFDGAPRFASCVALEPTRFALLTRAALEAFVSEVPDAGTALLLGWAGMLSERLRQVGGRLFDQIEAARAA